MRTATQFEFDCPACGARRVIDAEQRDALIDCPHCGTDFPAPDFRTGRLDPPPPPRSYDYRCACPVCKHEIDVGESGIGCDLRCPVCEHAFRQPPPAWEQWRRPVAKIFTRADRRRSLHHLMLSRDYVAWPDERLNERDRRRFEFYCGGCGYLRQARVWDIACQLDCRVCDALMIVPSPRWRRAPSARAWPVLRALAAEQYCSSLYCPQCGKEITPADRTRERLAHCPSCNIWF